MTGLIRLRLWKTPFFLDAAPERRHRAVKTELEATGQTDDTTKLRQNDKEDRELKNDEVKSKSKGRR
jgi:hypothetical protein